MLIPKTKEYLPEIFGLTLTIGGLLLLANVIPA